MNAVITSSSSSHVELRSFAVEAADAEVGVLLDRAAPRRSAQSAGHECYGC